MKKYIFLFLLVISGVVESLHASKEPSGVTDEKICPLGEVWDVGYRSCTNPSLKRTELWKVWGDTTPCIGSGNLLVNCLIVEFPGKSVGLLHDTIKGFLPESGFYYLLRVEIIRSKNDTYRFSHIVKKVFLRK